MGSDSISAVAVTPSGAESTSPNEIPTKSARTADSGENSITTGGGAPSATTATPSGENEGPSEVERALAKKEWGQLVNMLNTFPEVRNYSQAKGIVRRLMGPTARIWRKDNAIQVGVMNGIQKIITGEGATYTEALKLTALTLARINARENTKARTNGSEKQDEVREADAQVLEHDERQSGPADAGVGTAGH